MKNKLFENYEILDSEIKLLEAKRDQIKEQCLAEMQKEELDQVKSPSGTFFIVPRKTWKYTKKVEAEKKKLDLLKKKEEESGAAKVTINNSLTYRPLKADE